MEYRISVNKNADGLLRCDSPEAERFIRPVVYPTASCLLRVLAQITTDAEGEVVVSGAELGGRCGVGEAKIAKAMSRLSEAKHGILELEEVDSDTARVSLNQWLNPPRASVRAQRFPPELQDEFDDFLAQAAAIVEQRHPAKSEVTAQRGDATASAMSI